MGTPSLEDRYRLKYQHWIAMEYINLVLSEMQLVPSINTRNDLPHGMNLIMSL